jgi:AhpD family alkylhydroperoxidase
MSGCEKDTFRNHEEEVMKRAKVYKEIKEMLGLVPTMFKIVPDETLEMEWEIFKTVQLAPGAIPNKYRELMGLAISAVTKCKYCIFFHAEMAKLNGASEAEIEEALHGAKLSAGWSAYISGHQLDFDQFKKEILQVCQHVRKQKGKKKR